MESEHFNVLAHSDICLHDCDSEGFDRCSSDHGSSRFVALTSCGAMDGF